MTKNEDNNPVEKTVKHAALQDANSRTEKEKEIYDAVKAVQDPEIFKSIVDLGLVYGVYFNEEEGSAKISMTLTSPMCPFGPMIIKEVEDVSLSLEYVKESKVELLWEPAWDPKEMASDEIKMELGIW